VYFHQPCNSIGDDLYNGYWYRSFSWHLHFHKGCELVLALDGELFAEVEGKEYRLQRGDALLIMPYQLHSYVTRSYSEAFVIVFSGSYVGEFTAATAGKVAASPFFRPTAETLELLKRHVLRTPEDRKQTNWIAPTPPLFYLKACLYAVCADFNAGTQWLEKTQRHDLVFRILDYIEQNYTEDITLTTLADALGYEYHYLSRNFRETLHIRFRTLLNQYRCEHAKMLIASGDMPLAEIAMKCGFGSIRSFNRIFLEMTGETPRMVRK